MRRGAADTGADDHLAAADDHRPIDLFDDALGYGRSLQLARRVTVNDEFVAAPARDQIAWSDDGVEPARDLDQQLVAGAVAETVVDLLEVVEIKKHHSQAFRQGLSGMKGPGEFVLEAAAVWDRKAPFC